MNGEQHGTDCSRPIIVRLVGIAFTFVILVVGAAALVISLVISNSNMFDSGDTYDNYDK